MFLAYSAFAGVEISPALKDWYLLGGGIVSFLFSLSGLIAGIVSKHNTRSKIASAGIVLGILGVLSFCFLLLAFLVII